MDTLELQKIAQHSRLMRESGIAIVIASCLLSLFLFIPIAPKESSSEQIIIETAPTIQDAFAFVPIEAKAAIVYDLATNKTLYEKNSETQLPLASLTKLITVYAALSELSPDTPIKISSNASKVEGAHIFPAGQVFRLDDLARLTLTASLNDGAAAIAEAISEREGRSQAEALASVAVALDLSQTFVLNGHGLDINEVVSGGYGSAVDMARLAGALITKSPFISEATTKSTAQAISKDNTSFTVPNTDPMVDTIPHILLSKTGYTDLAGGNLVLVFDAGIGHPVAVVVLGSSKKARFTDGLSLVSATFAHFAGVASL